MTSSGSSGSGEKPLLERLRQFLFHDIWVMDLASLAGSRGIIVRSARVVYLAFRGLRQDDLPLHASALTFSTLIALVPTFAVALSMSRGLGAGQELVGRLHEWIAAMPDHIRDYLDQVVQQVSNTNFYAVGTTGGLILLVMVIQMLSSIEASFNRIWGITTSRNILRRGANYISTLVVVPVLILASGAIITFFEQIAGRLGGAVVFGGLLQFSPLLATWFAFTFLFIFMPNTRVQAGPAAGGGLFGAILWLSWLRLYVAFQPGVARYNVIYGTLASVPIFLAWLYVSWIIILLGAELAFAIQNSKTYNMERAAPRASIHSKMLLALGIVTRAAESLLLDKTPFEAARFVRDRAISIRLVHEVLGLLVKAGLLAEVADQEGRYVLLRAPERILVKDVIDVIIRDGSRPDELGLDSLRDVVRAVLTTFDEGVEKSIGALTIHDLMPKP
jgi:membrane protein